MMIFLYCFFGFQICFILLLTIVNRWEKRMVWPYSIPQQQAPLADMNEDAIAANTGPLPNPQQNVLSHYGARRVQEARQAGFVLLGWANDLKGARYQVHYALLHSPERDCFVIIGFGTIINIPLRATTIYSRTADGNVFYTTDHQAAIEIDVARQWKGQLATVSSFTELLHRHRKTLEEQHLIPQPFTTGQELEEFKHCREQHFQHLAAKRFIAFTDDTAGHWRYTFWGALKLAFLNQTIGTLRAYTGGRAFKIA